MHGATPHLRYKLPALRELVILDPQWIMDAISMIILNYELEDHRKPCHKKAARKYMTEWGNLKNSGILSAKLLECLWEEPHFADQKDALLQLMGHFGLIVPIKVCRSLANGQPGSSGSGGLSAGSSPRALPRCAFCHQRWRLCVSLRALSLFSAWRVRARRKAISCRRCSLTSPIPPNHPKRRREHLTSSYISPSLARPSPRDRLSGRKPI